MLCWLFRDRHAAPAVDFKYGESVPLQRNQKPTASVNGQLEPDCDNCARIKTLLTFQQNDALENFVVLTILRSLVENTAKSDTV